RLRAQEVQGEACQVGWNACPAAASSDRDRPALNPAARSASVHPAGARWHGYNSFTSRMLSVAPIFEGPPMRILRIRHGFQADHSSSSYLFYAIDQPVSAAGQRVAHRFSSRAEVDEQFARYQKWGESELSSNSFPALLGEHYDVM